MNRRPYLIAFACDANGDSVFELRANHLSRRRIKSRIKQAVRQTGLEQDTAVGLFQERGAFLRRKHWPPQFGSAQDRRAWTRDSRKRKTAQA